MPLRVIAAEHDLRHRHQVEQCAHGDLVDRIGDVEIQFARFMPDAVRRDLCVALAHWGNCSQRRYPTDDVT
jgi:hypothetical protein